MSELHSETRFSQRLGLLLAVWFLIALAVAATGLLARLPLPPPAIALLLTAIILSLLWRSAAAREHATRLGTSALVGFHVVRLFAGAYFLFLYQRGVLPGEFANPAGWGDILIAIGALFVLWFCLPVRRPAQRTGLLIWNTVGLLDILLVLANGVRLFVNDPSFGAPFTQFPLALLPVFVVPLVISSHVVLFAWPPRPVADRK